MTPNNRLITDPVTEMDPSCCDVPEGQRHEECWPIEIPAKDPFYALFRRRCMEFVRSASSLKANCRLGNFNKSVPLNFDLVNRIQDRGRSSI